MLFIPAVSLIQNSLNKSDSNIAVSAVILAGGVSSRMGYPKAWLPYDDRQTFLGRIIRVFKAAGISDVVTVLNGNYSTGVWSSKYEEIVNESRIVLNHESSKGRMHSLRLALTEISHPYVFIHNVDNPYIKPEMINKLWPKTNDEVVSPVFENRRGHPVLISRKVVNAIMDKSGEDMLLKNILSDFKSRPVDVGDPSIFKNVNLPSDYLLARYELDS